MGIITELPGKATNTTNAPFPPKAPNATPEIGNKQSSSYF